MVPSPGRPRRGGPSGRLAGGQSVEVLAEVRVRLKAADRVLGGGLRVTRRVVARCAIRELDPEDRTGDRLPPAACGGGLDEVLAGGGGGDGLGHFVLLFLGGDTTLARVPCVVQPLRRNWSEPLVTGAKDRGQDMRK